MSLHILWGGPWNERSSIAAFGIQIVGELTARGHHVEVVRTELGPDASLPAPQSQLRTRFWHDVSIHELRREVDAVIVNFGDSYSAHGAMLDNFADAGVVGIFHDRVLARLAEGWANDTSPDPYARLRRMVDVTYGRRAWRKGQPFLAPVDVVVRARPMLEWFAAGVCGAMTRDGQGAARARVACAGPVDVMTAAAQFSLLGKRGTNAGAELVIAIAGADESDRHIELIVRAIAESGRLRRACSLRFIGHIEQPVRSRTARTARKLGIRPPSFPPWASTDELPALLSDVDVVVSAGASVQGCPTPSTVMALCSGRPALIFTDHDSEVPHDCVLACAPGNEIADARAHLEWILDNPSGARAIAERAHAFALRTYTPARYLDALLPLVEAAVANRPLTLTGQALGRVLASFGVEPDDPAVHRVGGVLSDMLGSPDR